MKSTSAGSGMARRRSAMKTNAPFSTPMSSGIDPRSRRPMPAPSSPTAPGGRPRRRASPCPALCSDLAELVGRSRASGEVTGSGFAERASQPQPRSRRRSPGGRAPERSSLRPGAGRPRPRHAPRSTRSSERRRVGTGRRATAAGPAPGRRGSGGQRPGVGDVDARQPARRGGRRRRRSRSAWRARTGTTSPLGELVEQREQLVAHPVAEVGGVEVGRVVDRREPLLGAERHASRLGAGRGSDGGRAACRPGRPGRLPAAG